MSRENKLALVIGFGLLLLAGIFVSDHLSAQHRTDEEPLVASEELVLPGADILAVHPTPPPPRAEAPKLQAASSPVPPPIPPVREIVIGQRSSKPTPSSLQVHFVAKGETLIAIARKYYGDTDHIEHIARQNNLTNPNRLVIGTRLVLPKVGTPTPIAQAPVRRAETPSTAPPPTVTVKTVTVRDGDTLGEISKREFGTTKRWPEIAAINKDILPNPDVLTLGMTLRLPNS